MRENKAKKIYAEVKKSYNLIAEEFSGTRKNPGPEFPKFLPHIKGSILDLGCGNGRLATYLEQRKIGLSKFDYVGIDSNNKLLKIAKKNNPHHKFIKGDFLKIPLKDDSINTVLFLRSFHHLPSKKMRKKTLFEIKRVLKKDGIIIITVWNLWNRKQFDRIMKAFFRWIFTLGGYSYKDLFIPWGKKTNRYYHAFTTGELKKIVAGSDFKIIDFHKDKDLIIIAKNES